MRIEAPSSSVQSTWSLLRISMSEGASIWPPVTGPGPVARSVMRLGPSACMRSASCLMLRTMSTTSSRTPSIEENSWTTPSICTEVTAAPCSEDRSTRRSALPRVTPKPRSSGSATMRARRSLSFPVSIRGFSGRISSFQFLSITDSVPRTGLADPSNSVGEGEYDIQLLDAPTLGRPAAVMRNRGHVANGGDGEAHGLQRPQGRLTA